MVKYLYRYQSLRSPFGKLNLERLLLHNEFYCPSPLTFNDPFDCQFPFTYDDLTEESVASINKHFCILENPSATPAEIEADIQAKKLNGWVKGGQKWAKWLDGWTDDCRELLSDLGVVCFSECFDQILMWGHYADGHRGVCVQFSQEVLARTLPFLGKVNCQPQYPSLNDYARNPLELDKIMALTKADKWAYEQEWRLVCETTRGRVLKPTENVVSSVILGCETPEEDETLVRNWVGERFPIFRAKKNDANFGIIIPGFTG